MRLSKFLMLISFITSVSCFYVYQQTEIFRLAYNGKKKQYFQDLLDKNNFLRYNINRKSSLACIGNQVSKSSDFQMPEAYCLVRLNSAKRRPLALGVTKKETFLAKIFGVMRQAEAKTIETPGK